MSAVHPETLPKGALAIAGALVLFSLAATATVRIAHLPAAASPVLLRAEQKVAPAQVRELRFLDRPDGSVLIQDVGSGGTASVIEAGSQSGFIRGVMRGLARDRRMRGIGDMPPFRLTLWRDGELSLTDSATGRTIELGAFGATNRAAFAALLPSRKPAR